MGHERVAGGGDTGHRRGRVGVRGGDRRVVRGGDLGEVLIRRVAERDDRGPGLGLVAGSEGGAGDVDAAEPVHVGGDPDVRVGVRVEVVGGDRPDCRVRGEGQVHLVGTEPDLVFPVVRGAVVPLERKEELIGPRVLVPPPRVPAGDRGTVENRGDVAERHDVHHVVPRRVEARTVGIDDGLEEPVHPTGGGDEATTGRGDTPVSPGELRGAVGGGLGTTSGEPVVVDAGREVHEVDAGELVLGPLGHGSLSMRNRRRSTSSRSE